MKFTAMAPSNIALIKYMGKKEGSANIPENESLSLTLNGLRTYAEISVSANSEGSEKIQWRPELPGLPFGAIEIRTLQIPILNEEGKNRICSQVDRARRAASEVLPMFALEFRKESLTERWELRTANTFPASTGIASSASSFAAVTLASLYACSKNTGAFTKAWKENVEFKRAVARVSRAGSGSSCRSFEGPWVSWKGDSAQKLETKMPEMGHFVILVSKSEKKVSSSRAHALAKTSPLWEKREERLAGRIEKMKAALNSADFKTVSKLAWSETWEMHSLFHTASEPFTYWEPETMDVLHDLAPVISGPNALDPPPIMTMDAGPNVHILVEKRRVNFWRFWLKERFPDKEILEDQEGRGAEIVEL